MSTAGDRDATIDAALTYLVMGTDQNGNPVQETVQDDDFSRALEGFLRPMPTTSFEPDGHPTCGPDDDCLACGGMGAARQWGSFALCLCTRPASPWPRGRALGSYQELLTYRWGRILFINGGFAGECGQWAYLTPEAASVKPRSHLR